MEHDNDCLKTILCSDETVIELFGHMDLGYDWRKASEAFNPNNTLSTVKHGGGSIMNWGCFAGSGLGELYCIMIKEDYREIIKNNIKQSALKLSLGRRSTFQQDNDPKHTAIIVMKFFKDNNINVLEYPAQSAEITLIENLWIHLKRKIRERKPSKLEDLEVIAKEEWRKIPEDVCNNLIRN